MLGLVTKKPCSGRHIMVLLTRLSTTSSVHNSKLTLTAAKSLSGRARGQAVFQGLSAQRPYSRSQGVAICAKLLFNRKLKVAAAVLAGALAVWVSRDSLSDLSADNRGSSTGSSQPVAYKEGGLAFKVLSNQA